MWLGVSTGKSVKIFCRNVFSHTIPDDCFCSHYSGGLDLILMPGLGFDKMGRRLGRGRGYYDTYLERCLRHPKGKPYTIGLAFKEQLGQEIPIDDNDVPIDEVLFEDD